MQFRMITFPLCFKVFFETFESSSFMRGQCDRSLTGMTAVPPPRTKGITFWKKSKLIAQKGKQPFRLTLSTSDLKLWLWPCLCWCKLATSGKLSPMATAAASSANLRQGSVVVGLRRPLTTIARGRFPSSLFAPPPHCDQMRRVIADSGDIKGADDNFVQNKRLVYSMGSVVNLHCVT